MKKTLKKMTMLLFVATVATLASCSKYEKIPGFKTNDGILYHRIDKQNKNGKPVCVNNAIVGELTLRLDNVVLGSNEGNPDVLLYTDQETINSSFDCLESSFQKGILMLHEGEIATFAFIADTVWKYNPQLLQGTHYQQGKGKEMIMYMTINIHHIMSASEYEQYQRQQEEEYQRMMGEAFREALDNAFYNGYRHKYLHSKPL